VQTLATGAMIGCGALGMHDAASGRHQVDVAGMDGRGAAEAVAMHDLAIEQKGDGGEPDMGMRPHVDALAGTELDRPEMVEEDEGPDHAPFDVGQGAADRKAAEIDAARHDHEIDGVAGRRIAGSRIRAWRKAHGGCSAVNCSIESRPGCLLDVERLGAGRLAGGIERDLLHPRLGLVQQLLAAALEQLAAFIDGDRFLERHLAFLEPLDDGLELLDGALEGEKLDVGMGSYRP